MSQSAVTPSDLSRRHLVTAFGSFDVAEHDTLVFAEGLPGFEQCRRFVVLSSPDIDPLHCLQAIDGPPASFLAIDPRVVLPDYRCTLSDADRLKLGVTNDEPLVWLALVTMDTAQGPSVNLRAPVIVNPARMVGFQMMPHNSAYPLRHPLAAEY
jgi:flagellar assembly factor FliW